MEEEKDYIQYPKEIQPLEKSNTITHITAGGSSDKYNGYDSYYPRKEFEKLMPYEPIITGVGIGGHHIPDPNDSPPPAPAPVPNPIVAPPPPVVLPNLFPPVPEPAPVPEVVEFRPFTFGVLEGHKNMFADPTAFDAEIDDLIDSAYDENRAAGRIVTDEFADQTSKRSLQQQLDDKQKNEFIPSFYTTPELRNLFSHDPEMAEIFSHAFDAHIQIFARENIRMPITNVDELNDKLNLVALGDIYREMEGDGAEPMFVMSPNSQVSLEQWRLIYTHIANNDPNYDPFGGTDIPPLYIQNHTIEENWRALSKKENGCADVDGWTIRVMPTNRDYNLGKHDPVSVGNEINMPTIPEFLTAQAVRINQGLSPILGMDTLTQAKGPLLLNRGMTLITIHGSYDFHAKSILIRSGMSGPDEREGSLLRVYMRGLVTRGA